MSKPAFELAGIIKEHLCAFKENHRPLADHIRALQAIMRCRTAYLGGHVDQCDGCGHTRISYNSCRNRHCPKCQDINRERWVEQRTRDLLPTTYFHVVFTLPAELNAFCMKFPTAMYNMLFEASRETVEVFGRDAKHLGAQTGMVSILHTWGQNLSLHPHVHMIVPGGGITQAGYWKSAKAKGAFLFPVKAMSIVYKNKFMEKVRLFLENRQAPLDASLRKKLYNHNWVVYAKQPLGGPAQVIEYLGRYSHKVAISNHRIKRVADGRVSFTYKDYAQGAAQKVMTLDAAEFLRRFCLHILPRGFRKIRHYGLLASRNKLRLHVQQLSMGVAPRPKQKQGWKEITLRKLNFDVDACPCCKTGRMIRILTFEANAPPALHTLRATVCGTP